MVAYGGEGQAATIADDDEIVVAIPRELEGAAVGGFHDYLSGGKVDPGWVNWLAGVVAQQNVGCGAVFHLAVDDVLALNDGGTPGMTGAGDGREQGIAALQTVASGKRDQGENAWETSQE